jgi:hypothetical protein
MKNIVVIDNFYRNPEAVRRYALNKVSYISNENLPEKFPGTESQQSFYSADVISKMEQAIGERIVAEPAQYSFGVFAKTYAKDEKKKTIHVDGSDWTALLYLSRPEDCQGGTSFYEDKSLGWNQIPDIETLNQRGFESVEDFKNTYLKAMGQEYSNWKVSTRVGMKFNRMVIFRAGALFHAAEGYFGETDENCRLIQLFFFKTMKED